MLTIVGYSINATIVIFDRIRENLKEMPKKTELSEVVNASITQTLSRSINTSFTTFIMVAVLYVLGVTSIREFALPLIVGIVCGAYSSVCITANSRNDNGNYRIRLHFTADSGADGFRLDIVFCNAEVLGQYIAHFFSFFYRGLSSEKIYGIAKERKPINFLSRKAIFFAISLVLIVGGFVVMGVNNSVIITYIIRARADARPGRK